MDKYPKYIEEKGKRKKKDAGFQTAMRPERAKAL